LLTPDWDMHALLEGRASRGRVLTQLFWEDPTGEIPYGRVEQIYTVGYKGENRRGGVGGRRIFNKVCSKRIEPQKFSLKHELSTLDPNRGPPQRDYGGSELRRT